MSRRKRFATTKDLSNMEDSENGLKHYVLMESYHKALKRLVRNGDYSHYGKMMFAISEFILYGNEPDVEALGFDEGMLMAWDLLAPNIATTRNKAMAGQQGGKSGKGTIRNGGNKNAAKSDIDEQTKALLQEEEEANQKQTETTEQSKSIAEQKQNNSRTKAEQKQINTIKDMDMEKDKGGGGGDAHMRARETPPPSPTPMQELLNLDQSVEALARSDVWLDNLQALHHMTKADMVRLLPRFKAECVANGKDKPRTLEDAKAHFNSWLRKIREIGRDRAARQGQAEQSDIAAAEQRERERIQREQKDQRDRANAIPFAEYKRQKQARMRHEAAASTVGVP